MTKIKNILILDDIPSLAELIQTWLRQDYNRNEITIGSFVDIAKFKERLEICNPIDTLLMINTSFKTDSTSYRFELYGIKGIIKLGLRITWFKLHPVIACGTIPEEELLNSPIGRIFASNQYHKYLNLIKLREIKFKSLINIVSPIPDDEMLKSVINEYCESELRVFISSIEHDLRRTDKLYSKEGRKEFLDCLAHLQKVIYDDCVNKSKVEETIGLLKEYKQKKHSLIVENINLIREYLESFNKSKEGTYVHS